MVASGLVNRVDVSQYRLAAHLTLAVFIFAAIVWVALGVGRERRWSQAPGRWGALLLVGLVLLQIAAGGFVAGLDAGMGYNTWPKMDGHWIPPGLLVMEPQWRNFFENALTVQFNHRLLAYIIMLIAIMHAWNTFSMSAMVVAYLIAVQIGLGVATVVMKVPLSLGLVHQAGAMIVLWAAVWHLHRKLLQPDELPAFGLARA
jgi:cytochrome c oxidase assembly protein subunit 15